MDARRGIPRRRVALNLTRSVANASWLWMQQKKPGPHAKEGEGRSDLCPQDREASHIWQKSKPSRRACRVRKTATPRYLRQNNHWSYSPQLGTGDHNGRESEGSLNRARGNDIDPSTRTLRPKTRRKVSGERDCKEKRRQKGPCRKKYLCSRGPFRKCKNPKLRKVGQYTSGEARE